MVRLSEIATELQSGGRPSGGTADHETGILSLGGEHIAADGLFRLENKRFIPADFFHNMRRGKIQRDDILIVKDGATTGKVAFVDGSIPLPAGINEHVFRLAVDLTKALPRYVFYHLLSPVGQQQILRDFRGATVGGISQAFPDNVEFPLPDLAEQKRLTRMLDQANRLRRIRRYALDLGDDFVQRAFIKWFGNPSHQECETTKAPLATLCTKITDGTHRTPNYQERGIPFLSVKNVNTPTKKLDFDDVRYISAEEHQELIRRCRPEYEDILYTKVGATFGIPMLITTKKEFSEWHCPTRVTFLNTYPIFS